MQLWFLFALLQQWEKHSKFLDIFAWFWTAFLNQIVYGFGPFIIIVSILLKDFKFFEEHGQ